MLLTRIHMLFVLLKRHPPNMISQLFKLSPFLVKGLINLASFHRNNIIKPKSQKIFSPRPVSHQIHPPTLGTLIHHQRNHLVRKSPSIISLFLHNHQRTMVTNCPKSSYSLSFFLTVDSSGMFSPENPSRYPSFISSKIRLSVFLEASDRISISIKCSEISIAVKDFALKILYKGLGKFQPPSRLPRLANARPPRLSRLAGGMAKSP